MHAFAKLPANLVAPVDDGACDHRAGKALPSVDLTSTAGDEVVLGDIAGKFVLYGYPTASPDQVRGRLFASLALSGSKE